MPYPVLSIKLKCIAVLWIFDYAEMMALKIVKRLCVYVFLLWIHFRRIVITVFFRRIRGPFIVVMAAEGTLSNGFINIRNEDDRKLGGSKIQFLSPLHQPSTDLGDHPGSDEIGSFTIPANHRNDVPLSQPHISR
jgi:hypothetical protein